MAHIGIHADIVEFVTIETQGVWWSAAFDTET